MRQISSGLAGHLCAELTTLAELVKITREDGGIVAMTTHDADIVYDGVTYRADGSFSTADALTAGVALMADGFDIIGVLESSGITESDIDSGLYDHARIDVSLCNWADITQGVLCLRTGWLGTIERKNGTYSAALRGLGDLLSRRIGQTYTPECRYDLGEAKCGIDCAALSVVGAATGVVDRRHFYDSARGEESGYFDCAKMTWTSGLNAGASVEVKTWNGEDNVFTLWLPLAFDIAVGDAYVVTPGCDKRFSTCKARFGNVVNYGGFPHLPGLSRILLYPDGR